MTNASYLLASDWWICQIRSVLFIFPRNIQIWSQPSWYQQGDGSLLLIASAERDRVAAGTLRSGCTWCWGGREGRRERGRGEAKKRNLKRPFFPPSSNKSCSDVGGTRPGDLTNCWIGWSQCSIQQQPSAGGVPGYSGPGSGGSAPQSMGLPEDCEGISSAAHPTIDGRRFHSELSEPQQMQQLLVQWGANTRSCSCSCNAPKWFTPLRNVLTVYCEY